MYPMKTKTETKTLRTHYQFQSTPRNIRNLFKMADARLPFLSFILGLISDLIALFQANLALLILQADYSRRRQTIIRLLSLPVSRGGRLDLPLMWLLFLPWFAPFKLFLWLWRTSQQYKPTLKKFKDGSVIVFKSIHLFGVDGRKRCENATSGQDFVWKTEKKSCVFKRIRIRVGRALGKTWKIETWNRTKKLNRLPYKVYQPRLIYKRIV